MDPCPGPTLAMQMFNAFLAAMNVAFSTWLVQRRYKADKRENGNGGYRSSHMDHKRDRLPQTESDHEERGG